MPTEAAYNFFLDKKDRLMAQHPGCYVLISPLGKLCAIYVNEGDVAANSKKYGDNLLIIHLDPAGIKEMQLKDFSNYKKFYP